MELSIRSSLCRLCLCCDDSFACIFEDKASDQYIIASLLRELLQMEVSENDRYPKLICSACLKTITDFKTFKEGCLEAMITYDSVNRLPENGSVPQQLEEEQISTKGFTESFVKEEPNADNLDAFGNLLTNEESCSTEDGQASPIPGTDEIKDEPEISQVDVNEQSFSEEIYAEGIPLEVELNEGTFPEENFSEEIPMEIVEHPIKLEYAESQVYEDASSESAAHVQLEQNSGIRLTDPVKLAADVVTIQEGNVGTFEDTRDVFRNADLKGIDDGAEASTSAESMKTCCPSSVEEFNADGKTTLTPTRTICEHESIAVIKNVDNLLKQDREEQSEYHKRHKVVKSEISERTVTYRCNFCTKAFKRKESLASHIHTNREEMGSRCIRPNDSLSDHGKLNDHDSEPKRDKFFSCRFCKKCFKTNWNLIAHERTHTKEKPYKCQYCEKSFCNSSTLVTHLRIHTKEKPYKCSICEKSFTSSSYLTTHTRVHTNEKPYKCKYCEKCFMSNSNLSAHLKIHTNDKPHKCSYCEKCYSHPRELVRHIRSHTKEKPFKCSYCDKCFQGSSNRAVHMRYHRNEKPYKCSYCEKCFTVKNSLDIHIRTHTKEKPYKCPYCEKYFRTTGNLRDHQIVHRLEKPFKCSFCRKCYTRKSRLANHMRLHERETV